MSLKTWREGCLGFSPLSWISCIDKPDPFDPKDFERKWALGTFPGGLGEKSISDSSIRLNSWSKEEFIGSPWETKVVWNLELNGDKESIIETEFWPWEEGGEILLRSEREGLGIKEEEEDVEEGEKSSKRAFFII